MSATLLLELLRHACVLFSPMIVLTAFLFCCGVVAFAGDRGVNATDVAMRPGRVEQGLLPVKDGPPAPFTKL